MLRWLRRTKVKLGSIGGLLTVVEILTDLFGIAGDLMDALQQVGPDVLPAVLRLVALGLFPLLAFGALVAVLSAAWTILRWFVMAHNTLRQNDQWAARELQRHESRIRSCAHKLGRGLVADPLEYHSDLHVHLVRLAKDLAELGINIAPDNTWDEALWRHRLTVLAAQASYGDIEAARSRDTPPAIG